MRRVYITYAWRKLTSTAGLRVLVLLGFIFELSPFSPYLSLRHIFANMPPLYDVKAFLYFHMAAFVHTQLVVQLSLIAVALVLATYAHHLITRIADRLAHSGLSGQSAL